MNRRDEKGRDNLVLMTEIAVTYEPLRLLAFLFLRVGFAGQPAARTLQVSYRLDSLSAAGSKPVDAIALREFLAPRPPRTVARPEVLASAVPQRLAQWVSKLAEGERNRGLFWAACRLVEAGFVPADIDAALAPAAESAGLPTAEITATIRSASRQAAPHTPGARSEQWCDPRAQARGRGDAPCLG